MTARTWPAAMVVLGPESVEQRRVVGGGLSRVHSLGGAPQGEDTRCQPAPGRVLAAAPTIA